MMAIENLFLGFKSALNLINTMDQRVTKITLQKLPLNSSNGLEKNKVIQYIQNFIVSASVSLKLGVQ